MTVQELIEKLNLYPPDTKVIVHGYEDGYDLVTDILSKSIDQKTSVKWWDGEYNDAKDGKPAVLICSKRRWSTDDE